MLDFKTADNIAVMPKLLNELSLETGERRVYNMLGMCGLTSNGPRFYCLPHSRYAVLTQ